MTIRPARQGLPAPLGPDGIGGLAEGVIGTGPGLPMDAGEPQAEQYGHTGEARGPPERHVERVRQRARVRGNGALE